MNNIQQRAIIYASHLLFSCHCHCALLGGHVLENSRPLFLLFHYFSVFLFFLQRDKEFRPRTGSLSPVTARCLGAFSRQTFEALRGFFLFLRPQLFLLCFALFSSRKPARAVFCVFCVFCVFGRSRGPEDNYNGHMTK